jgi:hypothetical protein
MVHLAEDIGVATSFYDVDYKQVIRFLNTRIKHEQIDSDRSGYKYLERLSLEPQAVP